MKPSWKDAPEWAQWLAMDEDGTWCWFEFEPHVKHGINCLHDGQYKEAETGRDEPGATYMEPRP